MFQVSYVKQLSELVLRRLVIKRFEGFFEVALLERREELASRPMFGRIDSALLLVLLEVEVIVNTKFEFFSTI